MLTILCSECGGAESYSTSDQIGWPAKSFRRHFIIQSVCADCDNRKREAKKQKDLAHASSQTAKNKRDAPD